MKRLFTLATVLALGFVYSGGLVGCAQKTEKKVEKTTTTPEGKTTETHTDTLKTTEDKDK